MFDQRAFLGQVPIVGMGQAYPVNYPDSYAAYNELKRQYKEAVESGDEEMARFYQHLGEEMLESYYYIPGASIKDFSPTPPPPRNYTTPRRPRTDFSAPLPPTPTPSRSTPPRIPFSPRNIPEQAMAPAPQVTTPTSQPSTSSSFRESIATGQCPPGQIPDGRGGCRSVGQMPGIPTGLPFGPAASVAPMQLAPMSTPMSFMGRAMLGEVRLVKRGF